LLLVGFFVLNMFVGVVVENFHKCRESQEHEEKARREHRHAKGSTGTPTAAPARQRQHRHAKDSTGTPRTVPARQRQHRHAKDSTGTPPAAPARQRQHRHAKKSTGTRKSQRLRSHTPGSHR